MTILLLILFLSILVGSIILPERDRHLARIRAFVEATAYDDEYDDALDGLDEAKNLEQSEERGEEDINTIDYDSQPEWRQKQLLRAGFNLSVYQRKKEIREYDEMIKNYAASLGINARGKQSVEDLKKEIKKKEKNADFTGGSLPGFAFVKGGGRKGVMEDAKGNPIIHKSHLEDSQKEEKEESSSDEEEGKSNNLKPGANQGRYGRNYKANRQDRVSADRVGSDDDGGDDGNVDDRKYSGRNFGGSRGRGGPSRGNEGRGGFSSRGRSVSGGASSSNPSTSTNTNNTNYPKKDQLDTLEKQQLFNPLATPYVPPSKKSDAKSEHGHSGRGGGQGRRGGYQGGRGGHRGKGNQ